MTSSSDSTADHIVLDAIGSALLALPGDARIALAYSGGLDSTVLLDAAVRVAGPARCVALHVHHGLSPNADRWLAHCESTARACGVSFEARRVEVTREPGESVEALARDARYRALEAMCERHGAATLWLAQHADDQAETVLLQLLRGAGVAGLAAMAQERAEGVSMVPRARPLLHLLRGQLEAYARSLDLRWIEDESNTDTRYARNALRHDVIPALAVHFPGFRDALARTARHAASAQRLLDDLAELDMRTVTRDEGRALSQAALLALDDERALNVLRFWMRTLGLPTASAGRLTDALRQLRDASGDHRLRVDHAGQCLRLYRGEIYWEAGDSADSADETALAVRPPSELAWRGEEVWRLPLWRGSFVFVPAAGDAPDAVSEALLQQAPLTARSRAGGERMRVAPHGPTRTLKNLFQELGVPSWKRDVPLVYLGDHLLFVPLIGLNRDALRGEAPLRTGQPSRRIEWRPDLIVA
ncbi:tRNA lysidine(34) synthetase TilS [Trinickia terrae]|uniref:tRNA(Ile)-lysidine synthase n=1 Tax=Trinickia terrae TaxID=2571161 RepID=A0A4U1HMV8_9BURK|nr:tRNA lysidine(34) synthetase TilS [Trinickia terrae]TKC82645.1 tRNA lysidine(34) synthetase TilS [Trinickia terrae]